MYRFYEDSMHGWLKVTKKELADMRIEYKISKYSYMDGNDVYLEEDGDLNEFIERKLFLEWGKSSLSIKKKQEWFEENITNDKDIMNESFIRSFDAYVPPECSHDWHWEYDCFEDAVHQDIDDIGIPVKCSICGEEGIEWYSYSNVRAKDTGDIID